MGKLPGSDKSTTGPSSVVDCDNCLEVRRTDEGQIVLAAETSLSDGLGKRIGDLLTEEDMRGHMICEKIEVPTIAEMHELAQRCGWTKADLERYGLSSETIAEIMAYGKKELIEIREELPLAA